MTPKEKLLAILEMDTDIETLTELPEEELWAAVASRYAHYRNECMEQARLLGMSGEREVSLRARLPDTQALALPADFEDLPPRARLNAVAAQQATLTYQKNPVLLRDVLGGGLQGITHLPTPRLAEMLAQLHLTTHPQVSACLAELRATPDCRAIQWRTLWSSGPSSWDETNIQWFSANESDESIEAELSHQADMVHDWSEHYRGIEWRDITAEQYAQFQFPTN